jgi:hypothetical protein
VTFESTMTSEDRFWSRVDKSAGEEACWVWIGHLDKGGYGSFKPYREVRTGAHRYAARLAFGADAIEGLFVCHHCDNPACCNPAHLFPGTPAENNADCAAKGRVRWNTANRVRGERSPSARLTELDVRRIRAMHSAGSSHRKIAAALGFSNGAVYAVVSGRTWRHVQGGAA